MRLLQGLCLSILSLCGGIAQAQFSTIYFGDPDIEQAIDIYRQQNETVGLALVVVHDGEIVYMKGYGDEDREAGVAVDPKQTRFRWASISKTFAGALAVRAESGGYLDLDQNVTYYYPQYTVPKKYYVGDTLNNGQELPNSLRHISLRKLLTHTSGIQHYSNGLSQAAPPLSVAANKYINTGMEWALDYWKYNPLLYIPGTDEDYSTPALNLAGVVMEKKLGNTYENLVKSLIANPADMTTLRADTLWNPAPRRAVGYRLDPATALAVRDTIDDDISWKLAGGGFISTVEDLGKYAIAMLGDEILSGSEKQAMWTRHTLDDGTQLNRGLGWFINSAGSSHQNFRVRHTGSQRKARSVLALFPNRDLAVGIMTNSSFDCGTTELANQIDSIVRVRLDAGDPPIKSGFDRSILIVEQFYPAVGFATKSYSMVKKMAR